MDVFMKCSAMFCSGPLRLIM